ncbi:MAG TPA: hypothetical protein VF656_05690 [Pyrinomonadaceae bacterium]
MFKRAVSSALILLFIAASFSYAQQTARRGASSATAPEEGRRLVQAALAAMGGEARWRAVKSIQVEGIGHVNAVEQSERPEGPYIVSYEQTRELIDFAGARMRRTVESRDGQTTEWAARTFVVAGGVASAVRGDKAFPGSPLSLQEGELRIALGPERVLLSALDAADLRAEGETVLQGTPQRIVKFTWRERPVTVFLNANSQLPTAVETLGTHPYELWAVWGDVRTRVYYSYWTLEAGALRYPRQWDTERNNLKWRTFTAINLKLNPPTPEDALSISADVQKAYKARPSINFETAPLGRPGRPPHDTAPGVYSMPGGWDVTLVRQSDGIVIIEAPISSSYSVKVLDEAAKHFPGVPVKAVISTSDAWPHFGGVREYVARGIPVYALDLNRPILERLLAAPRTLNPDALARTPRRKPKFQIVSAKTMIGGGANRLELYPIRTETGERMMMVYFPEHRLLYGSDLLQKRPDGSFFMPQYVSEVISAAEREKLSVERVFAMHMDAMNWTDVAAAVSKATADTAAGDAPRE